MESKHQKLFIIGITLIIASFILGKLVFIPLLFKPSDTFWRAMVLIAYGITWIMLFLGIWFAGREGYCMVIEKYREHQRKTLHAVKYHGARAARKTYHMVKRTAKLPVKGISKGKEMVKRRMKTI
ncbi:hypothetical protein HY488_02870 [Candidatus Woesearchaeota archaeon]|nr:hypothetical protein [Candidatus Woesearchaeota archaeon]